MRIGVYVAVVLSMVMADRAAAQVLPIPRGWQMERAVLLSLYGVRAPETPNAELDRHAATPWPAWPVEPGFLTPRGAELMKLMGGFYRVLYGGRGLVQADDCPPVGSVSAWTDADQRSRLSGAALLAGMYPRCSRDVGLHHLSQAPDPLFHPSPTARCPMDAASNRQAVLNRIGGELQLGPAGVRRATRPGAGDALSAVIGRSRRAVRAVERGRGGRERA